MKQQLLLKLGSGLAVLAALAAGLWALSPGPSRKAGQARTAPELKPSGAAPALARDLNSATPTPTSKRALSAKPVLSINPGKDGVAVLLSEFDRLFSDPPPELTAAQTAELLSRRQAAKLELVDKLSNLGPGGARLIADAFKATDSLRDRLLMAQAFGKLNDRETVSVLKELLADPKGFFEQQQLIIALGHRTEPSVVEPLTRLVSADEPGALQFAAVQALAGRAGALPVLEGVIQTGSDRIVRLEAIRSIGLIGDENAKAALVDFAQAQAMEPIVRQTAIQELRRSFGQSAEGALTSLSNDSEPAVRASATAALAMLRK